MRTMCRNAFVYVCCAAASVAVTPGVSLAENWPGFRGPTRQGISHERDVPKVPSMLHVEPWLFLITESSVAKCLKAATGEVLWRQRLGGRYSASPAWADGRIYLLSEKGETVVIEAGPEFKVLARNKLEEKCCASPAVSQGNIFIRSERNLYCVGRNP